MAKEIERKFLVLDDSFMSQAVSESRVIQGYLSTDVNATVRVRIYGDNGFITIKSRTEGFTRNEWEYPVPLDDARELLHLCGAAVIDKTRYVVPAGELKWEVDVFHGRHKGLVMAEIELPSEDTPFDRPSFIGDEVTGNRLYYNSALARIKVKK